MTIASYQQAVRYLEGFIGKIIFKVSKEFVKEHDPLGRMRIFLSLLGNPQDKFKSVLVGGTSGKSSTSYLISHILTTAGYKTGFTLSPHLQKVNERLQINGQSISDSEFAKLTDSMIRIIEQMKKMRIGEPSYFEILIGMAFTYFTQQKVDIAVVEVGMGGEFDATNTLNPLIAVLTNVGLDHTNVLGKTVEKIARTKAGIIKGERGKGKGESELHPSPFTLHPVVVSGVKQPSVIKIVEGRSKNVGAQLKLLWRDFGYKIKKESTKGTHFDFISHEETLEDLKLSLLGSYQVENATLAIKTVLELRKIGFSHFAKASRDKKITDEVIKKALRTAFFPGRFEIISVVGPRLSVVRKSENRKPKTENRIVLDGAHNPTKMKEFLKNLKKLFAKERKVFIVGFKFDKDIKKMLKEILPIADKIIITQFKAKTDMNIHASADALKIKNQILKIKKDMKVTVEKDSKKALKIGIKTIQQPARDRLLPQATAGGYNNTAILVVTGSLYLVGEVRSLLK